MRWRARILSRRLIGLVLVATSAVAIWQSYATTSRQADFVECQAEVNAALIASLERSRETAAQERAATDDLYRSVGEEPEEFREAITEFFTQRRAADARRAQNPLPEPPTRRC